MTLRVKMKRMGDAGLENISFSLRKCVQLPCAATEAATDHFAGFSKLVFGGFGWLAT